MEHRSDISGDKIIDTCNTRINKSSNMTSKKELNSNGCTSVNTTTTYTNSSSMRMSESHFSCETNCFNKYSPLSQNFKEKSNSETASTSSSDSFSFIVQRVERLYGPGALAQGFYTRNKTQFSPPSQEREREEEYQNDNTESLPVLKLLRPEFRAQLSLAKRKSSNQRNNDSNGEAKERIIPIAIEQDLSEPDATVKEREVINPPSQKDGHFYLQLVCNEMKTLERLASDIETELENQATVPEDIAGRLRAAAGKARLLASQKLSQFKGLCQKNINQDTSEDFPTTCEDLAGFWDMVSIQINSVHEEFDKINKLKASGWTKDSLSDDDKSSKASATNGTTPTRRSKVNSKVNASAVKTNIGKTSNASKARDEERKRLIEERRKAMKKNLNSGANKDTVFVLAE
uniref:Disks large-associated protein 1 n=1 Tax=Clastoptera arizonana TaxID=38151 RepID=A0A1B6E5F0_9HEMI